MFMHLKALFPVESAVAATHIENALNLETAKFSYCIHTSEIFFRLVEAAHLRH